MEIIAHRGASFDAPENTIAAFRLAWEQGADAIECDVHLSRDGEIVVFHDFNTNRLAGVDRPVAEQTLAEIRAHDVGRWKAELFAGESIPTLRELLAEIPDGKRAYIEVKCGPEIVRDLITVLGGAKADAVVISFSTDVIATLKRERPDSMALWVVDLQTRLWTVADLIEHAKATHADGLDLSADPRITKNFVEEARAAGLPTYVWTVDDLATARRMIEAGVAGIATNRPGWLREQLAGR